MILNLKLSPIFFVEGGGRATFTSTLDAKISLTSEMILTSSIEFSFPFDNDFRWLLIIDGRLTSESLFSSQFSIDTWYFLTRLWFSVDSRCLLASWWPLSCLFSFYWSFAAVSNGGHLQMIIYWRVEDIINW